MQQAQSAFTVRGIGLMSLANCEHVRVLLQLLQLSDHGLIAQARRT